LENGCIPIFPKIKSAELHDGCSAGFEG
jgi:hypothetical protein